MHYSKYIVSDLKPIKSIDKTYFQSQYTAYNYGLTIDSENVANFIDDDKQKIQNLWDFSEIKFQKYTEILSEKLNKIHGTKYSNQFWKRVFSISLLNQITTVHQFYMYASQNFDPNIHNCEILSEEDYIINDNFDEQRKLLATDFGQEQLFSLYIKYFHPNLYKEFHFDKKHININISKKSKYSSFTKYLKLKKYTLERLSFKIKNIYFKLKYPKSKIVVGIMGSYFEAKYSAILNKKSSGKIQNILIPQLSDNISVNFQMRESISKIDPDMDDFDRFFFSSLKYLLPKYLLENFSLSINNFKKELKKYQSLEYIVSEAWLGSSSINLFRALGYEELDIKTYYNEHNCLFHPFVGNMVDIEANLVDKYLTLGWDCDDQKFKKLASLFPFKIPLLKEKYKILYVSSAVTNHKAYYSSVFNLSGAGAVKHLNYVSKFLKFLPTSILKKISYRSYPRDYFIHVKHYNKELFLKRYLKHVKFVSSLKHKGETCKEQMASSTLVIIDHIGTSNIEALHMNIPTIFFWDPKSRYLKNDYSSFFDELIEAKIVHTTPQSAAKHLKDVYENPLEWWNTNKIQNLKNKWLNKNFGNPDDMVEYLLKLSKDN